MTRPEPRQYFTRCEHCRAALPLTFPDLARAGGMVRCGSCGRTLNALAAVFDALPDDDAAPIRATGMPPMLAPHVEQEEIIGSAAAEDPAESGESGDDSGPVLHLDLEPEPAPGWMRWLWPALAVVLLLLLGLQLFGPERWRIDPATLGFAGDAPATLDGAIHLVSRDMHAHPSLDDAFVISAVLVNRAARTVAWPNIELKLFDASQQVVAQRRLAPREYLDPAADLDAGFAPGAHLPVVLEMAVESSRPAGFSMNFYYSADSG
ncbi:MAG: zinc-ribbon and DUF3426 domain-containing protein [Wenzhouxiangellaceae bacterium]|nr:zinc-ribbon and DUF3426 domain-containing protein [Wenzhouxiangellaceae bacterium]